MFFKTLFFSFAALFAASAYSVGDASDKKVICYHGTWATYRPEPGKFDVDDIQADLCTHLIYTFAGIEPNGTAKSLDPPLDFPEGRDNFKNFNALKNKNPNLKTLLAVGGWNEGSAKYSTMVASPDLRQNFISSIVNLLLQYGFDGCDLDWEYPARRDSTNGAADVDNFSTLVKEMRAEFDKHNFLISAAVAGIGEFAEISYDPPTIAQYLDWIGIMAYDFYGAYNETGYNAPLRSSAIANTASAYTVENAVNYWLGAGCPPEKLVLGVPFYGRTFTLQDPNQHTVGSPSTGPGTPGPYSQEAGNLGYNELCVMIANESWTVEFDELARVPYTYKDNIWVTFDNAESLTEKVNFAIEKNLAGVMIWSVETDDFHGTCGVTNPLLKAINSAFGKINEDQ